MTESPLVVSLVEQQALIAEVVSSPLFANEVRGGRAREILEFLFENHRLGKQVTQKDISLAMYGVNYVKTDSTVRVAIGRLRDLLQKYFESGVGRTSRIRLDIPSGKYALNFYRLLERMDLVEWFWNQYMQSKFEVSFGVVFPNNLREQWKNSNPHALMRAHGYMVRMMTSKQKGVTLLHRNWQDDQLSIDFTYNRSPSLIVGDDTCLTLRETFANEGIGESVVAFLGESSELTMFRDPADRAAIIRRPRSASRHIEDDDSYILRDSANVTYVLLTRNSCSDECAMTLLSSAHPEACADVAAMITTTEGLKSIATRPEFQKLDTPRDRTPADFQIVFSVRNRNWSNVWARSEFNQILAAVEIVDCRLGANSIKFTRERRHEVG